MINLMFESSQIYLPLMEMQISKTARMFENFHLTPSANQFAFHPRNRRETWNVESRPDFTSFFLTKTYLTRFILGMKMDPCEVPFRFSSLIFLASGLIPSFPSTSSRASAGAPKPRVQRHQQGCRHWQGPCWKMS